MEVLHYGKQSMNNIPPLSYLMEDCHGYTIIEDLEAWCNLYTEDIDWIKNLREK